MASGTEPKPAVSNEDISSLFTVPTGVSSPTATKILKNNSIVWMQLDYNTAVSITNSQTIGNLTNYRPYHDICGSIFNKQTGKPINGSVWIAPNGTIQYWGDDISSTRLIFDITYAC